MSLIQKLFSVTTILVFASTSLAAGKARVEVSAKKLDSGRAEFTFKTLPTDGLKINSDGPWKLEIKDPGSVKFEKLEMKKPDWKEADASFVQAGKIQSKAKSTQLAYKLTAFICTQDKAQCFREVIEGKTEVKW